MKARIPMERCPSPPKEMGKSTTGTWARVRSRLYLVSTCVTMWSAARSWSSGSLVSVVGVTVRGTCVGAWGRDQGGAWSTERDIPAHAGGGRAREKTVMLACGSSAWCKEHRHGSEQLKRRGGAVRAPPGGLGAAAGIGACALVAPA
eukprot:scaffold10735_cov124-Isochrysis_galbana.AAC.1